MEVKRVVKKPINFEAVQFNGKNGQALVHWMGKEATLIIPGGGLPFIDIGTEDENKRVFKDDWVIRETVPNEEVCFYPCRAEVFGKIYVELT